MCIAKKIIVLTIGLAASSHHALADPIFTLSSLTFSASSGETPADAASASTPNTVTVAGFDSVVHSTPSYTTVITLAPTSTTAGIATTYEKYRATTTHTDTSFTDTASFQMKNTAASTTRNQQVIRLMGLVTANLPTTLTYQLIGKGAYITEPNERREDELPREASLWFSSGSTLASVSDYKTDVRVTSSRSIPVELTYMQSSIFKKVNMTSGQQLYVGAEIDTRTNLSISDFVINFSSVYGGAVHTPTMTDVTNILSTSTISPLPEPATNVMLAAGLALMGMLVRRRKTPA